MGDFYKMAETPLDRAVDKVIADENARYLSKHTYLVKSVYRDRRLFQFAVVGSAEKAFNAAVKFSRDNPTLTVVVEGPANKVKP